MEEKQGLFKKIKETVVQEDNPNSPHLIFERMNKNMLGDDSEPRSAEPASQQEPVRKKKESPDKQFERLVWGDDE